MMDNLFDVEDKRVLVSGGSRGIGLAIAEGFANQGAKVVITGRDEETLEKACLKARETSIELDYLVCDVLSEDDINKCVEDMISRNGRIDTLVNCAGVNNRKPAEQISPDEYDQIMNINLRGAFIMAQAVGRIMIENGSGNQINIDSLSSYGPVNHIVPYSMSKSGQSSMTRGLALEWGKHGIRVNGLAPGFILTDLNRKLWSDPNMQAWNETVSPLKRLGSVKDLVATAIFLASPGAAFITGQIIRVDGGVSAGLNWPITGEFEVTHNH